MTRPVLVGATSPDDRANESGSDDNDSATMMMAAPVMTSAMMAASALAALCHGGERHNRNYRGEDRDTQHTSAHSSLPMKEQEDVSSSEGHYSIWAQKRYPC